MPKLIFTQPEFAEQFFQLPDGQFTVGRSGQNHIILQEDSVSGRHAELLIYGPEVIVRELESRNGTFVNNVRIQTQSGVKHGQTIRFGRVEVRLELATNPCDSRTEITAVFDHRRILKEEAAAPQQPTKLPATFTPSPPSSTA